MPTPRDVYRKMMETDYFSQWLGVESVEHRIGYCKIRMTVRKEMLNGFGILHGGVSYALADSALAFAANSRNVLSVSLDGYVSYPNPGAEGDLIFAEAEEITNNRKTALYDVRVTQTDGTPLMLFRATVYRTKREVIAQSPPPNTTETPK